MPTPSSQYARPKRCCHHDTRAHVASSSPPHNKDDNDDKDDNDAPSLALALSFILTYATTTASRRLATSRRPHPPHPSLHTR